MTAPSTVYIDGRPVRLGQRIGKGGEGEVFVLADDPKQALKIYSSPDAAREAKIAAMVAAGLANRSNLVAFPLAVARTQRGNFAGFSMRLVKAHKPLFELYSPGARKINFPNVDYRFLVRAAANVARAVANVHDSGAVIGDINHSGILISDKATAALIDADSFQFGHRFLCRVGVPEYTPPELQGVKLDGVVRSADHDAFGLAVVIFQLLFMGRHPFVGRYANGEMPMEKAISEFRFAYSARMNSGMVPPPGACRLEDFPDPVRAAFEAAFGRHPNARPAAKTWSETLQKLEGELSKCTTHANHFYPSAAGQCIWCRMEQKVGIILFPPTFAFTSNGSASDPGAAGFNLVAVWDAICQVRIPSTDSFLPIIQPCDVTASDEAEKRKRDSLANRWIGGIALLVAVGILAYAPALWLIYLPAAWFGIVKAFGNPALVNTFSARYKKADADYAAAVEDWKNRLGIREVIRLRTSLDDVKKNYEQLPQRERQQLGELQSKRRDAQLQQFLEGFPLRRTKIRGIGPSKQATLASYGIDTAAAVKLERILNIPGFGPATAAPLLAWRTRLESRFVYNPNPTPLDQQLTSKVKSDFAREAAELRRKLLAAPGELKNALLQIDARAKLPDPVINRTHREREQARVDLQLLGLPVKASPAIATTATPTPTARATVTPMTGAPNFGKKAGTGTGCPSCGGPMVRRVARQGRNSGRPFLGCSSYPQCRGTRPI